MKNAIIFGGGTIGSELIQQLPKQGVTVQSVVRLSGIYDASGTRIASIEDWKQFADTAEIAFIAVPSSGKGDVALEYATYLLDQGKPVITCEKASVAYHFEALKKYGPIFRYTASVGGGTQMLRKIAEKVPNITELKAVVNGTLNFIADGLRNGRDVDALVTEALEKGYAEPGAHTFTEVAAAELNDVRLKTTILANVSGLFERTISPEDVVVAPPDETTHRCIVRMSKDGIEAGFIEDNDAAWLPEGVDNVLCIDGVEIVRGLGAGAGATISSMLNDLS